MELKETTAAAENIASSDVLYLSFIGFQIRKRYFINLAVSFIIYSAAFLIFYFTQPETSFKTPDNLYLLFLFFFSLITGGLLSKKYNITRTDNYERTLTKLYNSFFINLMVLIFLLSLLKSPGIIWEFFFSVLFCAMVLEAYYFIIVIQKKFSQTGFFEYRKISFKYFIIDGLILTFFVYFGVLTNLISTQFHKKEILLFGIMYSGWLMSAFTTHNFVPPVMSINRWNALDIQIRFYVRYIAIIVISIIFLQLDYAISLYFLKAALGYTAVSALVSMFLFAPKVENKIDDTTIKFLKNYEIIQPVRRSNAEILKSKYSFINPNQAEAASSTNLNFKYIKDNDEVFSVLDSMLELSSFDTRQTVIIKSVESNGISHHSPNAYQLFVNLHVLNDQYHINDYLRRIRSSLVEGGVFVGALHPHLYRYNRFIKKYKFWIGNPLYFTDIIWKRVFPKLPITRRIYFKFRNSKDQALSLAEGLGRLVYTGFTILDLATVNNVVYFAAVRNQKPVPRKKFFYSPVFKMERIGKDGKIINVYKLRTMYPYSEFIQDFLIKLNGSKNGDKLNDDFRLPFWGKFFRKFWIDELPMIINLIKGEVKLVGVRAISSAKFNIYPKELQELRISTKPGLVPPFYKDLPNSLEGLFESEKKYILAYKKHPIKTDLEYFFKALYNIIFKKARSA